MLVLERKTNQRIYLSNDVTITVTEIDGNTVKLGIDAPPDVQIWRDDAKSVRNRLANGERLCDIESDLDYQENQKGL